MSCGTFPHPPGTAAHAHPADAVTGLAGASSSPVTVSKPGPVRVMWRNNRKVITPYLAAPVADLTAITGHFVTSGWFDHMLATIAAGILAEGVAEIRNARGKRRPAIRWQARRAILAGTVWAGVATMWSPWGGWEAMVQWPLALGLVAAGVHNHKKKRAAEPEPAQPALPPPDDPRLVAFRRKFCEGSHAPLRDAWVGNFVERSRGFELEVRFHEDADHTIANVRTLIPLIARLYDTSVENVSAGYVPHHRSEGRAQVIVLERVSPEEAMAKRVRFGGQSSYAPATGTVRAGGFPDDKRTNYRMHVPRSGAGVGMLVGAMGAGKTALMNRLSAEAGLMMSCAVCGHARTCEVCDLRRICALFASTGQPQSMGVWKGKADLFGSGPEGTVELLQFLKTVADDRGHVLDTIEWSDTGPDGKIRRNVGKGWFDPEPVFPLLFAPVSEFPLLANHENRALAAEALALLIMAFTTWRKVGIHLLVDGQFADMSAMGARELREAARVWNLIAMRLDKTGSSMTDIKGDPTKLPPDEKGVGYAAGPDDRSDVKFTADWFPEYNEPGDTGADVRHVADMIARTPIELDSSVTRAMEAFGLKHQDVITEWKGHGGAEAAAAPAQAPGTAPGSALYGLPYRDDAERVKGHLGTEPVSMRDLMEATDLALGPVDQSIRHLIANGDAKRVGDDAYIAA
jgi:hypothetical protein